MSFVDKCVAFCNSFFVLVVLFVSLSEGRRQKKKNTCSQSVLELAFKFFDGFESYRRSTLSCNKNCSMQDEIGDWYLQRHRSSFFLMFGCVDFV